MTVCARCGHDWPPHTKSAIAAELLGGCLWCARDALTAADIDRIDAEYAERNAVKYMSAVEYAKFLSKGA